MKLSKSQKELDVPEQAYEKESLLASVQILVI